MQRKKNVCLVPYLDNVWDFKSCEAYSYTYTEYTEACLETCDELLPQTIYDVWVLTGYRYLGQRVDGLLMPLVEDPDLPAGRIARNTSLHKYLKWFEAYGERPEHVDMLVSGDNRYGVLGRFRLGVTDDRPRVIGKTEDLDRLEDVLEYCMKEYTPDKHLPGCSRKAERLGRWWLKDRVMNTGTDAAKALFTLYVMQFRSF